MNQSSEHIAQSVIDILVLAEKPTFTIDGETLILACQNQSVRLTKDLMNQRYNDALATLINLIIINLDKIKLSNAKLAIIQFVSFGANVNMQDNKGYSYLHWVIDKSNVELTTLLLEKNADLNIKNEYGETPLHIAAKVGHIKLASLLLDRGAEINSQTKEGYTPIHWAVDRVHVEFTTFLLEKKADLEIKDEIGDTPLHIAALVGHIQLANLLIDHGADLNSQNDKGSTPLHVVLGDFSDYFDFDFNHRFKKDRFKYELTSLLLEKKADPNIKDKRGNTPLHIAAKIGHIKLAKLLIDHGADLNSQNDKGSTPLHVVPDNFVGNLKDRFKYELTSLLLEKKADPNIKDKRGDTPLHIAVLEGQIKLAKLLIDHGADHSQTNMQGKTALDLAKEGKLKSNLSALKVMLNLFEPKSLEDTIVRSSESSEDNYTYETVEELSEEAPTLKKITIKDPIFKKQDWNAKLNAIMNALDAEEEPGIRNALNQLAQHARLHLDSKWVTLRADQGRAKYNQLVQLMDKLQNVSGDYKASKLKFAQQIIEKHLNKSTEESELLKNRGGFFGAYKTMSSLLNIFGVNNYEFRNRTAVSSTDHYLITLYNEIEKSEKPVGFIRASL